MTTHLLPQHTGAPGISAEREPRLTVTPGAGDRITFETSDAAYAQMDEVRDLAKVTEPLNPVTGPVLVEGAEPGDVLAVTIHDIELGEHGWSVYIPGAGALAGPMGDEWFVRRVPLVDGHAQVAEGVSVPMAPMIGCIGVARPGGEMSTVMPTYPTGGNMDLTDAAVGSTVYLPVQVAGALLYIGDLHAVMSRGESSFVAIEAAGRATVSVDLVKAADGRSRRHRERAGLRGARRPGAGLGHPGLRGPLRRAHPGARVLQGRRIRADERGGPHRARRADRLAGPRPRAPLPQRRGRDPGADQHRVPARRGEAPRGVTGGRWPAAWAELQS
ncbi:acetamidase/formamidase family protein [Kytococcus sedentarius]|uniref:acetamidase/formamidase family protein n=1 Tax=Kytococcus sedentarius TaxID=1276 RepID=UPI00019EC2DA|nr:acetamidase/formamidase family protein [Kytococcus sedentarius]